MTAQVTWSGRVSVYEVNKTFPSANIIIDMMLIGMRMRNIRVRHCNALLLAQQKIVNAAMGVI